VKFCDSGFIQRGRMEVGSYRIIEEHFSQKFQSEDNSESVNVRFPFRVTSTPLQDIVTMASYTYVGNPNPNLVSCSNTFTGV
jgi:hypothetical protein